MWVGVWVSPNPRGGGGQFAPSPHIPQDSSGHFVKFIWSPPHGPPRWERVCSHFAPMWASMVMLSFDLVLASGLPKFMGVMHALCRHVGLRTGGGDVATSLRCGP